MKNFSGKNCHSEILVCEIFFRPPQTRRQVSAAESYVLNDEPVNNSYVHKSCLKSLGDVLMRPRYSTLRPMLIVAFQLSL